MQKYPKVLLIVLDGFGVGKDYPFNAITRSKMPFYQALCKKHPMTQLLTSGEAVGLPAGTMGNSEVGHMNIAAGRIVYQELSRIDRDIRLKQFQLNAVLLDVLEKMKKAGPHSRLHLMGLLSDAGVHSHLDHLKSLIELAGSKNVPVTIHAFTDGRDTPPGSAEKYLDDLEAYLHSQPHALIGSVSGRYYAMDRDQRWERTEKAWKVLIGQATPEKKSAVTVVKESLAKNITDEFIEPVLLHSDRGRAPIADGDGVFFFNFRADRARQMTRAFIEEGFNGFPLIQRPKLNVYATMTEYDKKYKVPVAFSPQNLTQMLPDVLAQKNLQQFRIAETEKYAHVTFFFNGSREDPFAGEERSLVASPRDVPTYDLKPEMSAPEVTVRLVDKIQKGVAHFILVNYANPDMVGHTGNFTAAVKAMECIDSCLEKVISAAMKAGYNVMMTADHGNVEEMCEYDHLEVPHTQHTLNPVPFHLISNSFQGKLREGGVLADVAPTILELMNIPAPAEMTAQSLIEGPK